jgi:LysM repeat protein
VPAQAAFLVSAIFARRNPLVSTVNSASTSVRRLLPVAAVPAAMAGLAATFALGNASAASAATTAPAVTSATAPVTDHESAAALSPAAVSPARLLSLTVRSGQTIVQLNATQVAAIKPKGKHHRTLPAKYIVRSGDTLTSIARHLYHSADYWPVLYWANHTRIRYANDITVGQALTVPAKPAKVPGAPKTLAPAPAPAPVQVQVQVQVQAASSAGYSPASTVTAAPVQATATYSGSTGSFQACVIAAESGGNPQVMNSSGHYGLYQFSASTWAAYGGNPADFGNASVAEQNQVFANAMAAGGQSNWAPYDGC